MFTIRNDIKFPSQEKCYFIGMHIFIQVLILNWLIVLILIKPTFAQLN